MTKTSAVLRKLSLNAAKNWHQNSGANCRDNIKCGDMSPHYGKVPEDALVAAQKIRRPSGRPACDSSSGWSGPNVVLVGFDGHRCNAEAKGDANDDAKQCKPHGRLLFRSRHCTRRKSGEKNAPTAFRFLGKCSQGPNWIEDRKSANNMRKSSSRNSRCIRRSHRRSSRCTSGGMAPSSLIFEFTNENGGVPIYLRSPGASTGRWTRRGLPAARGYLSPCCAGPSISFCTGASVAHAKRSRRLR